MPPEAHTNVAVPAAKVLRVLGLTHEAQEIGDRRRGIEHALAGICALVGAQTSFMFVFDSLRTSVPQLSIVHGYSPERAPGVLAQYMSLGDDFDPLAQQVRAAYDGKTAVLARRREDLITDQHWYNSAYVNEFRRPWGFDHSIYSLQVLGQQCVAMSVSRPFGSTAFCAEDQALIEIFHMAISKTVALPFSGSRMALNQTRRASLAPRAQQTLDALLSGASNKDIAEQMRISPNTVHHYCKLVFRAFGAASRGELIAGWHGS